MVCGRGFDSRRLHHFNRSLNEGFALYATRKFTRGASVTGPRVGGLNRSSLTVNFV